MRTYLLVILVAVVVAGGLLGWSHWASAAGEKPEIGLPVTADPNPIVSVVVGTSETEYEQDPFEQTRLRRSTNRVKSLIYVRADGRVETKQVQ